MAEKTQVWSMEDLAVPEEQESAQKKKKNKTMTYAEGTQGPNERAPNVQSWNALSNKINIGLYTI